jgi:NADH-quinone oxidoreductase subunit L
MGAGSVIVGCHHEQDMRKYGGLWKLMPLTFGTYFLATWAISGVPIASGFYSKDQILWSVFSSHNLPMIGGTPLGHILWGLGLLTAFLTAFYMTRSLMLTFFTGSYRGDHKPHESPWTMTLPLWLLAIPSLLFGYMYGENLLHFLLDWTRADLKGGHEALAHNPVYHTLEVVSIIVAIAGVSVGVVCGVFRGVSASIVRAIPKLYDFFLNKWWLDELYAAVVVNPLRAISNLLFRGGDRAIIDASVNGVGAFVMASGELLRRAHMTSTIGFYSGAMLAGLVGIVLTWLLI